MNIRNADFAGSWYPADPRDCEREIRRFLKESSDKPELNRRPVGGIVPHAGWFFSGSISCNVIKALEDDAGVDVFIIFGMHLHAGSPNYIMTEGAWATPFGKLQIEHKIAKELTEKFSFVVETPENYTRDNTIELQLPFIQYFFRTAKIVPIGVPPTRKSLEIGIAVSKIANRMGLRVKILGSTDLTHYGLNYGFTPKGVGTEALEWVRNENDRRMIDAMLLMDPENVIREATKNQNACCSGAAAAAIAAGKQMGAQTARKLAYATSYEKNPGDSFVGYVGIIF
jgi:MEMO1 family protein